MPNVSEMITQPIVSSMIAEATMIWPRLRRMKFISRTTMATILIEEIESAVPRNSAATSRLCESARIEIGRNSTAEKPQRKGTATPVSDTAMAGAPILRTSFRSVSMPVSRSSISTPISDSPVIRLFCSALLGKMT